ncbi:MAG: cytidine deaminase, partial [Clostridia bacterium]|nr:cytidine deaminase [Clostridia bacterium]
GASMYLTGIEAGTGDYVANSCSCSMCKRLIINAGISTVYIRDTADEYRAIPVESWIVNDESLTGERGY